LLTTCGLNHVGGPESDEYGERGLHGPVSNIPAELESVIQPDPANGKLDMSITGIIKQTPIFGPSLELRRTISGKIGEASISIHDEVINRGNSSAPHMLLYHLNFGWPLIDEGTDILWQGNWKPRFEDGKNRIFKEDNNFKKCAGPMAEHSGFGEDVGVIDSYANASGDCLSGLYNEKIGLAVAIKYKKKQMPWLTNWQHLGRGEYVVGMEPGTNPPIGQAKARELGTLIMLEPGERRKYEVEIDVLGDKENISRFLEKVNQ
jgi:hypothetical protein